jgi:hypothetical protein
VPSEPHPFFRREPRLSFELLFAAVSETLLQVARRRLGVKIGFAAVLHTWTQKLLFHPHLHCIVVGGGLSEDGSPWVSCRDNYFVPVRVCGLSSAASSSKLEAALHGSQLDQRVLVGRGFAARAQTARSAANKTEPRCGATLAGDLVDRDASGVPHRILLEATARGGGLARDVQQLVLCVHGPARARPGRRAVEPAGH